MAKRIPIRVARKIAEQWDQDQVVIVTFEKVLGTCHMITYGKTLEDCEQAAMGGNSVKKALGWPEEQCHATPARVKAQGRSL